MDGDVTVRVRPLVHGEGAAVQAVFAGMSSRARYLRYHTPLPRLNSAMQRLLTDVDGVRHVALVAETQGPAGWRPVGIGRFVRTGDGEAEVAFEVVDELQHHGVGRRLLKELRNRAGALGYRWFVALVLPENRAALALLRSVFPTVTVTREGMTSRVVAHVPPPASRRTPAAPGQRAEPPATVRGARRVWACPARRPADDLAGSPPGPVRSRHPA